MVPLDGHTIVPVLVTVTGNVCVCFRPQPVGALLMSYVAAQPPKCDASDAHRPQSSGFSDLAYLAINAIC